MSLMMPKTYNSGYGTKTTRADSLQLPNPSKPYRHRGTRQKYHVLTATTPITQVPLSLNETTL